MPIIGYMYIILIVKTQKFLILILLDKAIPWTQK